MQLTVIVMAAQAYDAVVAQLDRMVDTNSQPVVRSCSPVQTAARVPATIG